jgi:NAD(P) transhydrogenase subunit alpha
MALFREQAREVDVIITTALVPGNKAPVLVPATSSRPRARLRRRRSRRRAGRQLRAHQARARRRARNGVTILGYTDLPEPHGPHGEPLFATTSCTSSPSSAAARNTASASAWTSRTTSCAPRSSRTRARSSRPPPKKEPSPRRGKAAPSAPKDREARGGAQRRMREAARDHHRRTTPSPSSTTRLRHRGAHGRNLVGTLARRGGLFVLGRFAPGDFLQHFTVFILACFVGWQVIWSVTPALHTPLMSVTNAISGIIVIGGMLQISGDARRRLDARRARRARRGHQHRGGFLVTQRMLRCFTGGSEMRHHLDRRLPHRGRAVHPLARRALEAGDGARRQHAGMRGHGARGARHRRQCGFSVRARREPSATGLTCSLGRACWVGAAWAACWRSASR